jgi:eukaryotic-like serine/threonine-protein kinase
VRTEGPTAVLADRYELDAELGRSGTGVVWRARDRVLDRTVAIKVLRPELGDDLGFAARLTEETRRAASISGPGLTRLFDTSEEDGVRYLVREHAEGRSLRSILATDGPMETPTAVRLVVRVLDALATVHRAGALRLDVKPENVIVSASGEDVRLTDLGIGAAVSATRPAEDALRILVLESAAPEQRHDGDVDGRTDVFLAAALLFELLSGEPPAGRRSVRDLEPDVPRELDGEIRRALSPDPAGRPRTAAELGAALRLFAGGAVAEDAEPRRWFRTWLALPLLLVLLAVGAIVVGLWLGRLELGGPLGIRAKPDAGSTSTPSPVEDRAVAISSVSPFDPFGDGAENDASAGAAIDGDPATAWQTETYFDATMNNKPGVGLLFDLGAERTITGYVLETPDPGFTFAVVVGDDPQTMATAAEDSTTAAATTRGSLAPVEGRYVLLWITSLVETGGGRRAEVAEFQVLGAG